MVGLGTEHRIDNLHLAQIEIQSLDFRMNFIFVAEENGDGDPFVNENLRRPQDLFLLPFRKDDPLRLPFGFVDQAAHDLLGAALQRLQRFAVFFHVLDRQPGDAAVHRGLRYGRRYMQQNARIERLRNQVLAAEGDDFVAVGAAHRIGDVLLGEIGQGHTRRHFHLVVDGAGMSVKGAAEKERKAQDVIDLVVVVAAAGADDNVVAHRLGLVRGDFRIGIGHREDDRVLGHGGDHFPGHRAFG